MIDKMENYEKRQAFEHDLINRRLTWLLSSQTILFAALALIVHNDVKEEYKTLFFKTISYLGIFISISIFISICMGIVAKYLNFRDEQKNQEKNPHKYDGPVQWGVRWYITAIALVPDIAMPVGFFAAWVCMRNFANLL